MHYDHKFPPWMGIIWRERWYWNHLIYPSDEAYEFTTFLATLYFTNEKHVDLFISCSLEDIIPGFLRTVDFFASVSPKKNIEKKIFFNETLSKLGRSFDGICTTSLHLYLRLNTSLFFLHLLHISSQLSSLGTSFIFCTMKVWKKRLSLPSCFLFARVELGPEKNSRWTFRGSYSNIEQLSRSAFRFWMTVLRKFSLQLCFSILSGGPEN